MVDLLASPKVRTFLQHAQNHRDAGDVPNAIESLRGALSQVLFAFDQELGGTPSLGAHLMSQATLGVQTNPSIGEVDVRAAFAIDAIRSELRVVALGLDLRRYFRVQRLFQHVFRGENRTPPLTDEDFLFCRDFVIEAALSGERYRWDEPLVPPAQPQKEEGNK